MGFVSCFNFSVSGVRLGEFDIGGVLYHANYFHLYESAREAFLAERGVPYPSLVTQGQHLAVVESQQQFLKPVRYGESLSIELSTSAVSKTSFCFDYRFFNEKGELIHKATTKHVLVSATSGAIRPTRLPKHLLDSLQAIASGQ